MAKTAHEQRAAKSAHAATIDKAEHTIAAAGIYTYRLSYPMMV
jgi:hypothetical protein